MGGTEDEACGGVGSLREACPLDKPRRRSAASRSSLLFLADVDADAMYHRKVGSSVFVG